MTTEGWEWVEILGALVLVSLLHHVISLSFFRGFRKFTLNFNLKLIFFFNLDSFYFPQDTTQIIGWSPIQIHTNDLLNYCLCGSKMSFSRNWHTQSLTWPAFNSAISIAMACRLNSYYDIQCTHQLQENYLNILWRVLLLYLK